ncbi:MAG: Crp/Fnr family transcriptional regulator [Saprospiraceae bacterium]
MNVISTNDQVFQFINSISQISEPTFEVYSSLFEKIDLKKGTYFAKQRRVEKNFGIILDGVVRTFFMTENGEEHIKSFGTPLTFIGGFSSLITGVKNEINVQAITNCTVLQAPYIELTQLFSRLPEVETLSRRITEGLFIWKEKREIQFLSMNAEKRYLQFRKDYEGLEFLIPQYYIAAYLGISPTQLSRIRRKLSIH